MKCRILYIGGALVLALAPVRLDAYCASPIYLQLWQTGFPDLVIPVYISTGAETTIEISGLSTDEAERFVIETISRHNEVSVGPCLEFAGYTATDIDYTLTGNPAFANRPFGITVDSFPCTVNRCPAQALACAAPSGGMDPKVRVSLVPQCPSGTGFGVINHQLISGADTFTVFLHEMGHAFGLLHTDRTQAECLNTAGAVFGNNPNGNAGTMNSVLGATNGAYREWRRDDIDGLSAIYPHRSTELATWDDIIFPQPPLESDLVPISGAESIRVPSPSSLSVLGDPAYFAAVDLTHRVVLYEDNGTGFMGPEIVDPGASGVTWGNPVLALGTDTIFVVWASAEEPDSLKVVRRWAVRDIQGVSWSYGQDSASAGARRYGAAYATTDFFVAATTHNATDFPIVTTFDTSGNHVDEVALDFRVFDLGGGACTGDLSLSTCLLPYSTENFAGPNLGYLEISVASSGSILIDPNPIESSVPAAGKMGLAQLSGSGERGTAGQSRYALLMPDATPTPAPVPLPLIDGEDWPVGIGASTSASGAPSWYGLTRRPVVCGNGILQGAEQCDDGNQVNGDGCDSSCAIEPSVGTTGGTTSETGGGDDLGGGNCECRVQRRSSAGGLLLLIPLMLRIRRRRCGAKPGSGHLSGAPPTEPG